MLGSISRLAGALLVVAGLAGCMEVGIEMEVLSETDGRAALAFELTPEAYATVRSAATTANDQGFCATHGAKLTEHPDGSATCIDINEFDLATVSKTDMQADFEVLGDGLVRVTFSTTSIRGEIFGALGLDPNDGELATRLAAGAEGATITLRVKGREIVESNMPVDAGRTSAEIVVPLPQLILGTAPPGQSWILPPALTATVRAD